MSVEENLTMKIYEVEAALVELKTEKEEFQMMKARIQALIEELLTSKIETLQKLAFSKEEQSKNMEQIIQRIAMVEQKVEEKSNSFPISKAPPIELFTVEQIRQRPWLAVPEDFDVKCIWSRCEKTFSPFIYRQGLVSCPHCGRDTPVEKPQDGKKWLYFWNCWHIHCVAADKKAETCWKCGGEGEIRESNVRTPLKKK